MFLYVREDKQQGDVDDKSIACVKMLFRCWFSAESVKLHISQNLCSHYSAAKEMNQIPSQCMKPAFELEFSGGFFPIIIPTWPKKQQKTHVFPSLLSRWMPGQGGDGVPGPVDPRGRPAGVHPLRRQRVRRPPGAGETGDAWPPGASRRRGFYAHLTSSPSPCRRTLSG